jgi:hypothetical protein
MFVVSLLYEKRSNRRLIHSDRLATFFLESFARFLDSTKNRKTRNIQIYDEKDQQTIQAAIHIQVLSSNFL